MGNLGESNYPAFILDTWLPSITFTPLFFFKHNYFMCRHNEMLAASTGLDYPIINEGLQKRLLTDSQ